jgi:hypothetical protein
MLHGKGGNVTSALLYDVPISQRASCSSLQVGRGAGAWCQDVTGVAILVCFTRSCTVIMLVVVSV